MSIKFDMSILTQKLKKASKVASEVIKPAYRYFLVSTPIRTGYARSHTRLKDKSILAKYPYAKKLDEGYSKQAPDGMVQPTVDEINRLVQKYIKKIGR